VSRITIPTDPPEELHQVLFRYRLYDGSRGEIGTFATSIGRWEPGETWTLPDGRSFRVVRVTAVAGSDIDALLDVDQLT
jgi:hypothetical protein